MSPPQMRGPKRGTGQDLPRAVSAPVPPRRAADRQARRVARNARFLPAVPRGPVGRSLVARMAAMAQSEVGLISQRARAASKLDIGGARLFSLSRVASVPAPPVPPRRHRRRQDECEEEKQQKLKKSDAIGQQERRRASTASGSLRRCTAAALAGENDVPHAPHHQAHGEHFESDHPRRAVAVQVDQPTRRGSREPRRARVR